MKRPSVFLLLGALPLLAFPFIFVGAVLWLAALGNLTGPIARRLPALVLAGGFQVTALLYPLMYITCVIVTVSLGRREKEPAAARISLLPLKYLGFCLLLPCWLDAA